jgi:heme-degrading monooxygenase HmoA
LTDYSPRGAVGDRSNKWLGTEEVFMIARHWRGVVKTEKSDDYITHLQKDTFPQLANIPGFVSASILRRSTARGVEFVILTTWDSMGAIRQFAGESPDVAVVPPFAQAMMVEYDKKVAHYEIAYSYR